MSVSTRCSSGIEYHYHSMSPLFIVTLILYPFIFGDCECRPLLSVLLIFYLAPSDAAEYHDMCNFKTGTSKRKTHFPSRKRKRNRKGEFIVCALKKDERL